MKPRIYRDDFGCEGLLWVATDGRQLAKFEHWHEALIFVRLFFYGGAR